MVPDIWYEVRKRVGDMRHTLPQGVVGPGFNDDFGDTFGIIYGFTADGFTQRELRDQVEAARSRLLRVPDVSKVEILGAQDERVFIEFSTERLAGLGLNYPALIAALQAQNLVRPAGMVQTGERAAVDPRLRRLRERSRTSLAVNFVAGGRHDPAGRHRRGPPRLRRSAAAAVPRQRPAGHRPGGRHARGRRHPGARHSNSGAEMAAITAELPIGIEPVLVADQAVTVDHAIGEFTESRCGRRSSSSWSSASSRSACAPGAVVALSIPLTLAIVLPADVAAGASTCSASRSAR